MKIEISRPTTKDVNIVYEFINKLENYTFDFSTFKEIYLKNLKNRDIYYLLANYNSIPIGFISVHLQLLLHHCGYVAEIQEFYIEDNYRGNGIGKLLFNELIILLKNKDIKSLEVTSNKNRNNNVEIYQKLGFKLSHNKFTIDDISSI